MEHPIVEIIKKGDNSKLKEMLAADSDLANGKTEQDLSFLQLAAYYRNTDAIALIREKKKSLDLYEAASIGDLERVQHHLKVSPESIDSYSNDGFTPLGLACYFGHLEIVKFLTNNGADVNKASSNSFHVAPLHSATAISNFEITEYLLANGANVNVRQQSGVTPLHSAAHNGQPKIAQLLIEHGADINARTDDGKTPFDMAVEKGYVETAELLRRK